MLEKDAVVQAETGTLISNTTFSLHVIPTIDIDNVDHTCLTLRLDGLCEKATQAVPGLGSSTAHILLSLAASVMAACMPRRLNWAEPDRFGISWL